MVIQCEHCETTYYFDESQLQDGPVDVRCIRCKKVFRVDATSKVSTEPLNTVQPLTEASPLTLVTPPVVQDTEIKTAPEPLPERDTDNDAFSPSSAESFSFDDVESESTSIQEQQPAPLDLPEQQVSTPPVAAPPIPPPIESKHEAEWDADNDAFSPSSAESFSFDEVEAENTTIKEQQPVPQEQPSQEFSFESIAPAPPVEAPIAAVESSASESVPPTEDTTPVPAPKRPRQKRKTSKLMIFLLLIILLIAGVYGYLFVTIGTTDVMKMIHSIQQQLNPAAQQTQGEIRIGTTESYYIDNQQAGQLFVIRGQASNGFPSPQSELSVTATLYKTGGKALRSTTAYCGNIISKEELKSADMATLTKHMKNPFGAALANVNIAPGQSLPFMLVFNKLPVELNEFSVEPASSKAASD